jgi:hypothetical protein
MAGNDNNITMGSATVCVGGTDIGYTQGGTKIRYTPTYVEVEADQAFGVVIRRKTNERMFVDTNMLEITLDNMKNIFGFPAANSFNTGKCLYLGYSDPCSNQEVAITVAAPGLDCCVRKWYFPRAISVTEAELNFQRDTPTVIAASFEILKGDIGIGVGAKKGVFGWVCDCTCSEPGTVTGAACQDCTSSLPS